MTSNRNYIFTLMLLLLFVFPNFGSAGDTTGVTDTEIRLGMFAPYTGPAQLFGYPMAAGATMIYSDINKKGGIHGRKITVIEQDSACSSEKALAAAKKLIYDDKVFMLHGGNCSAAAYAARETIMKEKIPWMILAATMDKLSYPTEKNIFTAQMTGGAEGEAIAKFILSNPKWKRVGILTHPNEWGMTKYKPAYDALKASGQVEIVADERIDRKISDATVQILKIKKAKPDVVFFNTYPVESVIVVRDALKYSLNVPIISGTSWDLVDIETKVGYKTIKDVYQLSTIKGAVASKAMQNWVDMCKEYHPEVKIVNLTFLATPGALMIVEALQRAGKDLTREKFIESLENIKDFETNLVPHPIGFTQDNHQANKRGNFFIMKPDKTIVSVGGTWPGQ